MEILGNCRFFQRNVSTERVRECVHSAEGSFIHRTLRDELKTKGMGLE